MIKTYRNHGAYGKICMPLDFMENGGYGNEWNYEKCNSKRTCGKGRRNESGEIYRLGEYRMNKAIDAIGRIENLANRSAYDYTPEQVEAMFSVLESKVAEVKAKFTATKAKENTAFSFGNRAE